MSEVPASFSAGDEDDDGLQDRAALLTPPARPRPGRRRPRPRPAIGAGRCLALVKTLAICLAFFSLGLCISLPGPTLLDLQDLVDVPLSHISQIFMWRAMGYLAGSTLSGMLFDRLNRLLMMLVSIVLSAVGMAVVPWLTRPWALYACFAAVGVPLGFIDTGGNVLLLDMWGKSAGPYMQAIHFSFSLGAFVAPLLAVPFISGGAAASNASAVTVLLGRSHLHTLPLPQPQALLEPQLERAERHLLAAELQLQRQDRLQPRYVRALLSLELASGSGGRGGGGAASRSDRMDGELTVLGVTEQIKEAAGSSTRLAAPTAVESASSPSDATDGGHGNATALLVGLTSPAATVVPPDGSSGNGSVAQPPADGTTVASTASPASPAAGGVVRHTPKPKPAFTDGSQLEHDETWARAPLKPAHRPTAAQAAGKGRPAAAGAAGLAAATPAQPGDGTAQPDSNITGTANSTAGLANSTTELANSTTELGNNTTELANSTTMLANSTSLPDNSTTQPADSNTQSVNDTHQPANSAAELANSTAQPTNGTANPTNSIARPPNNTVQPANGTGQLTAQPSNGVVRPPNSAAHSVNSAALSVNSAALSVNSAALSVDSTALSVNSTPQLNDSAAQAVNSSPGFDNSSAMPISSVSQLNSHSTSRTARPASASQVLAGAVQSVNGTALLPAATPGPPLAGSGEGDGSLSTGWHSAVDGSDVIAEPTTLGGARPAGGGLGAKPAPVAGGRPTQPTAAGGGAAQSPAGHVAELTGGQDLDTTTATAAGDTADRHSGAGRPASVGADAGSAVGVGTAAASVDGFGVGPETDATPGDELTTKRQFDDRPAMPQPGGAGEAPPSRPSAAQSSQPVADAGDGEPNFTAETTTGRRPGPAAAPAATSTARVPVVASSSGEDSLLAGGVEWSSGAAITEPDSADCRPGAGTCQTAATVTDGTAAGAAAVADRPPPANDSSPGEVNATATGPSRPHKPGTYDDTSSEDGLLTRLSSTATVHGVPPLAQLYLLAAGCLLLVALIFLALLVYDPRARRAAPNLDERAAPSRCRTAALVALTAAMLCFYVGMEVAMGQLLTSFSVHASVHLTRTGGAYVTSVFWGLLATGRALSVCVAGVLPPGAVLAVDFALVAAGAALLLAAGSWQRSALLVGCGVSGLGMASVFPSTLVWLEQHVHVGSRMTAALVVAGALGEMVVPAGVGALMAAEPRALVYVLAACVAVCAALQAAAVLTARMAPAVGAPVGPLEGYQLAAQEDDDDAVDPAKCPADRRGARLLRL